jgi:protease I
MLKVIHGKTMRDELHGKTVAILVAHGFEQSELEDPRQALVKAGAVTRIVSPEGDEVRGWDEVAFCNWFDVDVPLNKAREADFDALLLPGGVMNPDRLRSIPAAVDFARAFFEAGKPVAAIGHGLQLLVEADVVRGRTITSHPAIKTDLINAGAHWVDEKVVTDGGLITSRGLMDIPAFSEAFLEEMRTGKRRSAGDASVVQAGRLCR